MTTPKETYRAQYPTANLDDLLEDIEVLPPGEWDNEVSECALIKTWWAVVNTDGIIAYFGDERDAFRFRLDYINRILNP